MASGPGKGRPWCIVAVLAGVLTLGISRSALAQWTVLVAASTVTFDEVYDSEGNKVKPGGDETFKVEVPYWFVLAQYTHPIKGIAEDLNPSFTVGAITLFGQVKVTTQGQTLTSGLVPFWFWTYGTIGTKYLTLSGAYLVDLAPRPTEPGKISATNQSDEIRLTATARYPLSLPKGTLTLYGGIDYFMTLVHQEGPDEVDPGDLTIPAFGVSLSYPLGEKTNLSLDLSIRRRGFGPLKINGIERPNTAGHQWTLFPTITVAYERFFVTWVLVGLQDEYLPYGFTLSGKNGLVNDHLDFRIHVGYTF